MDGAVLDAIMGKSYDLPVFENELVKVESAGRCIRVGFKRNGVAFSWWEPTHPFYVMPEQKSLGKQNGWDVEIETRVTNVTKALFFKGGERHVLTLTCTSPEKTPKPIEVKWE